MHKQHTAHAGFIACHIQKYVANQCIIFSLFQLFLDLHWVSAYHSSAPAKLG